MFDGTLASDTLPTHLGQRHKLAKLPAVWVAELELAGCRNFQTPYRTVRDGAGLNSLTRKEARFKEKKAAVDKAVVAAEGEAAARTASGNAGTVPPSTEAPATGRGGVEARVGVAAPQEVFNGRQRVSAAALRYCPVEAPTHSQWPFLMALSAYAVDHIDASLLPAWRQPLSEALACVQLKLRDAPGRMWLLTLPSVVLHVPFLTLSRGMRPSPMFRTALIAMLLDRNFAAALRSSSVCVWRVSPSPRRRPYRQARRRRSMPAPAPLVALSLRPCFPAPYPLPVLPPEWYLEKYAANELCDS